YPFSRGPFAVLLRRTICSGTVPGQRLHQVDRQTCAGLFPGQDRDKLLELRSPINKHNGVRSNIGQFRLRWSSSVVSLFRSNSDAGLRQPSEAEWQEFQMTSPDRSEQE